MAADALRTLFSTDNPFRRKPQSADPSTPALSEKTAATSSGSVPAAATTTARAQIAKSGTVGDSETNEEAHDLVSEARVDVGTVREKRGKRKRDELERNYETKMFGGDIAEDEDEEPVKVAGRKRKGADGAEEMAAEAESKDDGFYDESKMLRTVFVGNLPVRTKRKALIKEFKQFGAVESVRIRSVPLIESEDKKPRRAAIMIGRINEAIDSVHAYIVFKEEESARAALTHNMAVFGDHHIRVDMACPPRKKMKSEGPLYDRKRAVFVGNIPFDIKDEELYSLFCGACKSDKDVEAVRVVRDPDTGKGKGIAYVLFKTREVANSMSRRGDLKIRDRSLRVCHVQKSYDNSTPKKRKGEEMTKDFSAKNQALSQGEESSKKNNRLKVKAASLSYQGVQSSKSGAVKKARSLPKPAMDGRKRSRDHGPAGGRSADGKLKKRKTGDREPKSKSAKRPAVAARKAKRKMLKKRKLEVGTPEGTHRSKKQKRY